MIYVDIDNQLKTFFKQGRRNNKHLEFMPTFSQTV